MNARWTLLIIAALLLVFVVSPLHTVYGDDPAPEPSASSSAPASSAPASSAPASSAPASSAPASAPIVIEPIIEPSPDIPAAYVLRVMICDTMLYDNPAGSVISNTSVVIGQIFSVDPVDAIAADGSHWTQLFVGGWNNPYVPSVCVQ